MQIERARQQRLEAGLEDEEADEEVDEEARKLKRTEDDVSSQGVEGCGEGGGDECVRASALTKSRGQVLPGIWCYAPTAC